MTTEREMPRYQSHKKVWALKIAKIEFNADSSANITPADEGYGVLTTKPEYDRRYQGSDDLGYFVVYEDGYQSWSPTKAFEDGYTAI